VYKLEWMYRCRGRSKRWSFGVSGDSSAYPRVFSIGQVYPALVSVVLVLVSVLVSVETVFLQ